jgi:trk system potassium uptake protein TrkA
MKAVVIGLGQFGYASAISLAKKGAHVVAVDVQMKIVESLRDDVALAVAADASDKASLEALDIADADVLIAAIGENFEAQLLTVVYAKQLGVRHIVARAATQTHKEILEEVGAHQVLNPEEASAQHMVSAMMMPGAQSSFTLADGFSVVKMEAPAGILGSSLLDLDLRRKFRLNVVALELSQADGVTHFDPVPDPERKLAKGDVLTLVGSDLDIAHFSSSQG